jgi:hypothetical protein
MGTLETVLKAVNFSDYHHWVSDNLRNEVGLHSDDPVLDFLLELCEKHDYKPQDEDMEWIEGELMHKIYCFSPLLHTYYSSCKITSMVQVDAVYIMAAIHRDVDLPGH